MTDETVVADTSVVVHPLGNRDTTASVDPNNSDTYVTQQDRVVIFHNESVFDDDRTDGVERTIVMKAKAKDSSDVQSQTSVNTWTWDYTPPYYKLHDPKVEVTVADNGEQTHTIHIYTEYKVTIKSSGAPDFIEKLGADTTVHES